MTSLILGKQNVGSEKIAPGADKFINTSVEFSFIVFQKRKEKVERKIENQNKSKIIICFV